VAAAVAVVDGLAVALLIVFFAAGEPFGTLNDVLNALVGVLSAVLAGVWPARPLGRAVALAGGIVMVAGSVLVIFDVTGYFLAGLVSAVGAALIGVWVVMASTGASRLGVVAGVVMLTGLLAVPGVLTRVDDQDAAPWYVVAGQVSWLGTYLLYPIWCLRLTTSGRRGRGRNGPG
jgi:hypothetical protein